MMIEVIEQVVFVERILHMAWKLLEQDYFVIFMECIIIILIPIILKVILEINIDLCWVAKAIVKFSHYSEEPIEVI